MIWCLPIIVSSQDNVTSTGIKWTEGLSWQQVKQKAKQEMKYIFIDAFATWCVPCKKMDKEVYINDTVANYFNEHFISIKVQMDKTKKDNAFVQSWYHDADSLARYTDGYPTFLFVSPGGNIVHKGLGYQSVAEFVSLAKIALKPETKYNDPYEEYYGLVEDYKKGVKRYDRMVYMIKTAQRIDSSDFWRMLLNDHTEYVASLPKDERYSKDAIEIWSGLLLGSDKKRFWFFYNDSELIDRIMGKQGYARGIVNKTIQEEFVWPFFKEQSEGTEVVMSKETMSLFNRSQKPDYTEADWKKLHKDIRKKYDKTYAEDNVVEAKIMWYGRHKNLNALTQAKLKKFERNPPDITDPEKLWMVNELGWNTFLGATDQKLINRSLFWMEKVVKHWGETLTLGPDFYDTYANLLYKTGRMEDAIKWEEKAILFLGKVPGRENDISGFEAIINKMKKGEPTYMEHGAVWMKK